MWHTLLKPRGYEIEQGQLVRSPSKSQELQKKQEMHDSSMRVDSGPAGTGSVIEAFRRANSFAAAQVHTVPTLPRQPFRRSTPLPGADDLTAASSSGVIDPPQPDSSTQRLFSGIAFRVLGEARCAAVRKALEGCGGQIIGDDDMDAHVDFIIVRLVR
jgi:DNA replication regulator DPB11